MVNILIIDEQVKLRSKEHIEHELSTKAAEVFIFN